MKHLMVYNHAGNGIKTDGAQSLSEMLKVNTTLTLLDLGCLIVRVVHEDNETVLTHFMKQQIVIMLMIKLCHCVKDLG